MSNPVIPIDRHEAQKSGQAIQEAQDSVMTTAATATIALIRQLLKSLKLGQKDVNVEIAINDSVAYKANVKNKELDVKAQTPELSEKQLRYLQEVIKLPPSNQPGVASIPLDQDVQITINGKEVFRLHDGVVENNKLAPTVEKTGVLPSKNVETSTRQGKTSSSPVTSGQKTVQEAKTSSLPVTSGQKTVQEAKTSSLPVTPGQNTTRQGKTSSLPIPSRQKTTTEAKTLPSPVSPKASTSQTAKIPPIPGVQAPKSTVSTQIEQSSVPSVPVEIVTENSPQQGQKGVSLSGEQKQELHKLGVNLDQVQNAVANAPQGNVPIILVLNREIERNVPKSSLKENLKGSIPRFQNAIRDFSRKVSTFLSSAREKLSPAANRGLKQDLQNIAVTNVASKLLDRFGGKTEDGKQVFEGNSFRIERTGRDLTVSAKDGRGTILSLKNGELEGSLTQKDVEKFQAVDRQLDRGKSRQSQAEIG
ncbi:hypothetical protein [Gloeothece verrucosa]|uniref:Uncharacterized protein n=1 Tax=Gloeothece verrucosa (strain PCC 7822) TaxID=497965 RepID=E0U7D2_GLOV7|nr:hypothetical protein [Gloeothece verrucosa]ADN12519.1 hypothetical protein Cyan7822_0476 [Gloeothece verrucosa PCC 7822]